MSEIDRALLLAPMRSEQRPLIRLSGARRWVSNGVDLHRTEVAGTEIAIGRLGVGPERARRSTERALSAFPADHVVVSGIAGGLDPSMTIGTLIVPEAVIDLASGERFLSSPLGDVDRGGTVGTSVGLVTGEEELARIQSLGVVAVEMESSGVAAACRAAGIPWTTVRVISDRPDDGMTDDAVMSLLRPDGSTDVMSAVKLVLVHPGRVASLARLARDSSRAAAKAARHVLGALGWTP